MSPPRQHLDRVLLLADRQQRREVADVLLEEVEDRGDPALAEPHARAHALGAQLLRAGVGGLLEERDARLAPQLLAEEERRVAASASWIPAIACAAFQCMPNADGSTCRCSCTLVQAASGVIVSA